MPVFILFLDILTETYLNAEFELQIERESELVNVEKNLVLFSSLAHHVFSVTIFS